MDRRVHGNTEKGMPGDKHRVTRTHLTETAGARPSHSAPPSVDRPAGPSPVVGFKGTDSASSENFAQSASVESRHQQTNLSKFGIRDGPPGNRGDLRTCNAEVPEDPREGDVTWGQVGATRDSRRSPGPVRKLLGRTERPGGYSSFASVPADRAKHVRSREQEAGHVAGHTATC